MIANSIFEFLDNEPDASFAMFNHAICQGSIVDYRHCMLELRVNYR